jgi:hypothetical protein
MVTIPRLKRRLHACYYRASSWAVRPETLRVTFGLVNYRSPVIERIEREILPTIAHYPKGQFEIICIDNSPERSPDVEALLERIDVPTRYVWNEGRNVKVAAAKNQIYQLASHPTVVYLCANHGRMYDPTWLEDIVRPLKRREVAQAGHVKLCKNPPPQTAPGDILFVQGGILAVKVEAMRRNPMPDDHPHAYSDVAISWHLQQSGYQIADVPTILSYWRMPTPAKHHCKYVHAED